LATGLTEVVIATAMSLCDSISQVVHLISLTNEEEEAIRFVFEKELQLQKDEDDRLKLVTNLGTVPSLHVVGYT